MDKFWPYIGGIIGGYALTEATLGSLGLSSVDPVLDLVGSLSMVVFSGMLVYHAARTMFGK